jgi:hypothetical protein
MANNVEKRVQDDVDTYVAWVEAAETVEEADEGALELMRLEGFFEEEVRRPGHSIKASSFGSGAKRISTAPPNMGSLKRRLAIVQKGLEKVEKVYAAHSWRF